MNLELEMLRSTSDLKESRKASRHWIAAHPAEDAKDLVQKKIGFSISSALSSVCVIFNHSSLILLALYF